jgi:hypothetical protein
MAMPNSITLEGKLEDIGSLRFLRAEWQDPKSRFVLIRYSLNGKEQPLGVRLDLDKKVLLDSVGDQELDKSVQAVAPTLWSIIANEPLAAFSGAALDVSGSRLSPLGPLAELAGSWVGPGFNLGSLPDKQHNNPFRLQVSATWEMLELTPIGGMIPIRASRQNDIALTGLTYRHQIVDGYTRQGLHFEPGLWLNVPSTTDPAQDATVVRQAARIQHGGALLAQGHAFSAAGGPVIAAVASIPFTGEIPDLNAMPATTITFPEYTAPYADTLLPAERVPYGLNVAQIIENPTVVLQAAVAGQNIIHTNVITISTVPAGGIVNIPFIVQNANATRLDAIYWIERVRGSEGEEFLQLQYVQRIILDFNGIRWPQISVATMVKQ